MRIPIITTYYYSLSVGWLVGWFVVCCCVLDTTGYDEAGSGLVGIVADLGNSCTHTHTQRERESERETDM